MHDILSNAVHTYAELSTDRRKACSAAVMPSRVEVMTTHNEPSASDFGRASRRAAAARSGRKKKPTRSPTGPTPPRQRPDRTAQSSRDQSTGEEVLKLSSPADVRAAVPYLIGFKPERSLVFLGLTEDKHRLAVTGRINAPTEVADAEHCADSVASVVLRTEARQVLVVYFGPLPAASGRYPDTEACDRADESTVRDLADVIEERLGDAGIEVVAWVWEASEGRSRAEEVDASSPFELASVVAGHRTFGSRAELAEQVAARPSAMRPVIAETITRLGALRLPTEDLMEGLEDLLASRGRWDDDLRSLPPLTGQQAALCCLALARFPIRDALIGSLALSREPSFEDLWCEVLHIAPDESIAPIASVLAIEVYLKGNGVLARCALDRALQSDPDYSLAHLMQNSLDYGLPPTEVRAGFASAFEKVRRDAAART